MAIENIFSVEVELKSGIKTLFNDQWRYFTVPAYVHKDWRFDEGCGRYVFSLGEELFEKFKSDAEIYEILQAIKNECENSYMTVTPNDGTADMDEEYRVKYRHYRCNISLLLLRKLKSIFVSSLVYNAQGEKLPDGFVESMTLEFDAEERKVVLKDLKLYKTDDIYLKYARQAAGRTSFASVFEEEKDNSKVKNFYKEISPWYEYSKLEEMEKQLANGEDIYNVIYVLYNEEDNSIYVGKAERMITRLRQHEKNMSEGESMPKFTHFRYSILSEGYEDYIYIIENSAIHDLAYIFNMPKAKTYCSPLSKNFPELKLGDVKINNRVEAQTKKAKK